MKQAAYKREILAGMQPRTPETYRPQPRRSKRRALTDDELAVGMVIEIRDEPWKIAELLDTDNGRFVVVCEPTPENSFYDALRYDDANWPRWLTELEKAYRV